MRHFQITLIDGTGRTVRNIIARSAMRATQIALGMLPEHPGQFAIICKPGALPCAA